MTATKTLSALHQRLRHITGLEIAIDLERDDRVARGDAYYETIACD